jgi:hypothetical protein
MSTSTLVLLPFSLGEVGNQWQLCLETRWKFIQRTKYNTMLTLHRVDMPTPCGAGFPFQTVNATVVVSEDMTLGQNFPFLLRRLKGKLYC